MRTLQRLGSLTALGALASMLTLAAGQQVPTFTPEQEARLRIREVMDGLYVIPGFDGGQSGGNVAVRVTDEGVIIVDNKFPYSFDFITEQVGSITNQPIKYVLNTHHHDDHSGSAAADLAVFGWVTTDCSGRPATNGQPAADSVARNGRRRFPEYASAGVRVDRWRPVAGEGQPTRRLIRLFAAGNLRWRATIGSGFGSLRPGRCEVHASAGCGRR